MPGNDRLFAGSIPEVYDRLLVPMIFDPYARILADRIAAAKPADVLETAAGTGALTRALAARLPAAARIVATDLNQPMLDIAAARMPPDSRIAWRQADALALPFADRSFDAVACQFGAMFFPDKVQGYREARRMLRPGGIFVFDVWDALAQNAFVSVVSRALAMVFPADPPTFMERTPHGYHDVQEIAGQLAEAGFASSKAETIDHLATAATPRDAARAYCEGTPLRSEIEARGGQLDDVTAAVAAALAQAFGNGPIQGRVRAHVITALS